MNKVGIYQQLNLIKDIPSNWIGFADNHNQVRNVGICELFLNRGIAFCNILKNII